MPPGDKYRAKAARLSNARGTITPEIRAERENLARAYLRLAEQADRNTEATISCMIPVTDQDSSEA